MQMIGGNIDKIAFTSSARKKKDSIFLKIFVENEFTKRRQIEGLGTFKSSPPFNYAE